MLKKLAAIGLTAGALVLGAPLAASAAPAEVALDAQAAYTDGPGGTVDRPVIDQCDSSTIAFAAGYFLAGETVSVSISGAYAADATISGSTAAADGSLVVSFRPPQDGAGSYVLTFVGAERSASATITVADQGAASTCGHDPAAAAPSGTELPLTGSAESGMELALTGGGVSTLAIVGGAAALAAGGALVIAGSRRKRA